MYKVGIIGCGRIASEFEDDPLREHPCTHAGAFSAVPQTKIACAADIERSKLEKFSKQWGVNRLYADYREMRSREELDIVSVCTPPETHSQITIDALIKSSASNRPVKVGIWEGKV